MQLPPRPGKPRKPKHAFIALRLPSFSPFASGRAVLGWCVRQIIDAISRVVFSLRFRLLLLVLLVCAPLVGLTLHSASTERRREMASWRERSEQIARIARREEEALIRETRQLLLAVSESSAVRSTNREACKKSLDEMFSTYPGYVNLAVIETNGEVLASALPLAEARKRAERTYFRRVLQTRAFVVGSYFSGATNGRPTAVFGSPVFDRFGQVQAVVVAWVGLDRLARAGSEVAAHVPEGANWTMIDRNGRVLARYPGSRSASGQRLPDEALLKTAFSEPRDIVKASDSRGIPSFYAFGSLDSRLVAGNAMTILGIPKQILFAAGNQALIRNLSWISVAAQPGPRAGLGGEQFAHRAARQGAGPRQRPLGERRAEHPHGAASWQRRTGPAHPHV